MGWRRHRLAESIVVITVVAGIVGTIVLTTGSPYAEARDTVLSANTRALVTDLQCVLVDDAGSLGSGGQTLGDALAVRLREGAAASPRARFANPDTGSVDIVSADLDAVSTQKTPAVLISADPDVCAIGNEGVDEQAPALDGAIIVSVDQTSRTLQVFWIGVDGARSAAVVTLPF